MSWQSLVHSAIEKSQGWAEHIVAGLSAVKDSEIVAKLADTVPEIKPFVAKLEAAIPWFGTADAALNVLDWGVQHWRAIEILGAAAHYAPADVLTFKPWMDSSDPSARQE